ncbi:SHQ1 protein-domain-containing protein [Desarmillaria tabescens]|uniref:SHQ1 protein-domain-containing protein n=1 Tax=Armillaria tabescens TaxID=1929756 RepID=A0AA39N6Y7_ARMTA|nr:SHQ1 protein-domain-containing protein [Desarmillaria tabescens]KAK0459575.1 SHQ1 protein-domain-containing protein [Desarmillaria tabescens]
MITPRFSCRQTVESVVISVYCPSVRASDVELNVDDTLFTLHINPYFLRLNFSHALLEDDKSSATYDGGTGYLTVVLTKQTRGQEFRDLDLLAKLLAPRPSSNEVKIEVLDSSPEDDNDLVAKTQALSIEPDVLEAAQNDWQMPQTVPDLLPPLHLSTSYGFLNRHSGYFVHVTHTENEVNELGAEAEQLSSEERRHIRIQHEDDKWDEEYYMADFAESDNIEPFLSWSHPHINTSGDFQFTEAEELVMLNLPRVEFLVTAMETHNLYLTLINLLFSYSYESRTTHHDPTPESAWTISSLTPCFSALDPPPYCDQTFTHADIFSPSEIASTFIASYRRSLAFPLYRSFTLAERCRLDVAELLMKGRRTLARCLLEMKDILDHHEVYYIYSKIWVNDFCVWIQVHAKDETLQLLGKSVKSAKIAKSSIGWDLEQLEALVLDAQVRSSDSDEDSDDDDI